MLLELFPCKLSLLQIIFSLLSDASDVGGADRESVFRGREWSASNVIVNPLELYYGGIGKVFEN